MPALANYIYLPMRYRLWRSSHIRLVAQDLWKLASQPERENIVHLDAVLDWLCRAQDIRNNHPDAGGVSAGWSFEDGWLSGYPETSGYIVETFIAAADTLNRPEMESRARRILDWELSIQNPDGSFPGHFGEPGSRPVIFNTGQIMHGLAAGHLAFSAPQYLEAAVRAGRWLVVQQDDDGCWRRSVHNGIPHTYNTRAAWALLRTGLMADEKMLMRAAICNLEWALTQATECGWFRQNAFVSDAPPFTHTIAYAIRGLLESGILLDDERFIGAAVKAARAMARAQRVDGWLVGRYDDGWIPRGRYCCLTGVAQMTLIWQRMHQSCGESDLQVHIDRGLSYLKRNHRITGRGSPDDGGIAGSAPFWGGYSRFEFPNWAAKFFADALMMEMTDKPIPQVVHFANPLVMEHAYG